MQIKNAKYYIGWLLTGRYSVFNTYFSKPILLINMIEVFS